MFSTSPLQESVIPHVINRAVLPLFALTLFQLFPQISLRKSSQSGQVHPSPDLLHPPLTSSVRTTGCDSRARLSPCCCPEELHARWASRSAAPLCSDHLASACWMFLTPLHRHSWSDSWQHGSRAWQMLKVELYPRSRFMLIVRKWCKKRCNYCIVNDYHYDNDYIESPCCLSLWNRWRLCCFIGHCFV